MYSALIYEKAAERAFSDPSGNFWWHLPNQEDADAAFLMGYWGTRDGGNNPAEWTNEERALFFLFLAAMVRAGDL